MGAGCGHSHQPEVVGLYGRHHGDQPGQQPGERGSADCVPSGLKRVDRHKLFSPFIDKNFKGGAVACICVTAPPPILPAHLFPDSPFPEIAPQYPFTLLILFLTKENSCSAISVISEPKMYLSEVSYWHRKKSVSRWIKT